MNNDISLFSAAPIGIVVGTPTYLFGSVSVYSFTMILGMICSILTVYYFWRRNKYPSDILIKLIIIAIPSAIIGARLFFLLERAIYDPAGFDWSTWWMIWTGGLSIQGGVFVPVVTGLIYIRSKKQYVDYKVVLSIIIPTILIGQAIGRWGNYANHEVYGRITDGNSLSWLGPIIKENMFISIDAETPGNYRVPLFFYEFLSNFIGYIVLVWILNFFNYTKPGSTAGLYMIWYGVTRVSMEPLREESYAFYTIMSAMMIAFGLFYFAWCEFQGRKQYILNVVRDFKVNIKGKTFIVSRIIFWESKKHEFVTIKNNNKWLNE